jgi:hypothetical protein
MLAWLYKKINGLIEKMKKNLWGDGINEAMKKEQVSFKEDNVDPSKLVGYQEIATTHLIFDVKLGEIF